MKPTNEALKNYQLSDISYDKSANLAKATFTEDLTSNDKSSLKEIIVDIFGVKPGWVGQNGMVLSIPEKEFNNFQKLLILDLQMKLADEEVTNEAGKAGKVNRNSFVPIGVMVKDFKESWNTKEMNREAKLVPGGEWVDINTGGDSEMMMCLTPEMQKALPKDQSTMFMMTVGDLMWDADKKDFVTILTNNDGTEKAVWLQKGKGEAEIEEFMNSNESVKPVVESFSSILKGSINEAMDFEDNEIAEGDTVEVVGRTEHEGKKGQVVETSDTSDFVIVEIKGKNYSYHASDLKKIDEDEEEMEEEDDYEYDEDAERTYEYVIDLDERGDFRAHVEDHEGDTVFEIDGMDDLMSLIDDGFMKHKDDTDGLLKHLQEIGELGKDAILESLDAKIDRFINEAFREGTASHFDSLLKEWSKKSGIDYEMKFKELKGKSKPYFVLKTDYEGYIALPSEIKTELNGLLKRFGVDFSYRNKTWTPVIEGLNEDFGDDDALSLDNSEPEYEVIVNTDQPRDAQTAHKVAKKLDISGSPDTGFIVATKVLLRKFVNTLRGFDLAVSKILDGHNNEVALASIEAYKPKGRPTNKYNYPNRMRESVTNEEKLIKGAALTPEQKKLVLAAFVYRNTKENEQNVRKVLKDKADTMKFEVSDDKWIEDHAFWFNNDGKTLSGRKKHAEPHYLADESVNEAYSIDQAKQDFESDGRAHFHGSDEKEMEVFHALMDYLKEQGIEYGETNITPEQYTLYDTTKFDSNLRRIKK